MSWILRVLGGKWLTVIGAVVITALISGIFYLGYSRGTDHGFDNAYDQFQQDIRVLDSQWRDAVSLRDEEIISSITNEFNILDSRIQNYIRNDELERELLGRLDVVASTLKEIQNETADTDFGTCDLSPEFERLLHSAREAISQPRTD